MNDRFVAKRSSLHVLFVLLLCAMLFCPVSKCYANTTTLESYFPAPQIEAAKVHDSHSDRRPNVYVPDDEREDEKNHTPWWLIVLQLVLFIACFVGVMLVIAIAFDAIKNKIMDRLFFRQYGIERNGPEHEAIKRQQKLKALLEEVERSAPDR